MKRMKKCNNYYGTVDVYMCVWLCWFRHIVFLLCICYHSPFSLQDSLYFVLYLTISQLPSLWRRYEHGLYVTLTIRFQWNLLDMKVFYDMIWRSRQRVLTYRVMQKRPNVRTFIRLEKCIYNYVLKKQNLILNRPETTKSKLIQWPKRRNEHLYSLIREKKKTQTKSKLS